MDKLLAVLPLDFLAVHHRIPTDLARLGGLRVRVVHPRAEGAKQPFAFRRRGRIETEQHPAALIQDGRAEPARDERDDVLRELIGLVENQQIVGTATVLLLVARIGATAEFDLLAGCRVVPESGRTVETAN